MLENLVEVRLKKRNDFLIVKETLTRIGIASKKDKILWQSCHILHKQGKYAIVHFKEMFRLDGKHTDITEEDIARRNTITNLLAEWGLLEIVDPKQTKSPIVPISSIKILHADEKDDWDLRVKYTLGVKR